MSRDSVDYVIKAVAMVAKHGWKLLPQVSMLNLSLGEVELGNLSQTTSVIYSGTPVLLS